MLTAYSLSILHLRYFISNSMFSYEYSMREFALGILLLGIGKANGRVVTIPMRIAVDMQLIDLDLNT